eukprot:1157061-Pelagomonas_calceolata.AAC.12
MSLQGRTAYQKMCWKPLYPYIMKGGICAAFKISSPKPRQAEAIQIFASTENPGAFKMNAPVSSNSKVSRHDDERKSNTIIHFKLHDGLSGSARVRIAAEHCHCVISETEEKGKEGNTILAFIDNNDNNNNNNNNNSNNNSNNNNKNNDP